MAALDETAARLRALVPGYPDAYSVQTGAAAGTEWCALDEVPVEQWCADARETANPRRLTSVAATSVGGALAHAVLGRVTAALALDGRAWDLAASGLLVHRAPEGYLDRLVLSRPVAWVLPDDPAGVDRGGAAAAGVDPAAGAVRVFPGLDALLDAVGAGAVATLAPLFARVRAATRFGLVPLWNAAADTVRTTAAYVPLYAGAAPRDALADALLDALVAHGAPIRSRGAAQPLPGRAEMLPVRAACCLFHRTDPPVARPSDAFCTTCPFLAPPERATRYAAFVDAVSPARPADRRSR